MVKIINNQSDTILTFNGRTALSSTDKYFSGSTKLKFMNPCARLQDSDGKKYMMMRGTFNLINDEWDGQWVQVYFNSVGLTNGTTDWKTGGQVAGNPLSMGTTPNTPNIP